MAYGCVPLWLANGSLCYRCTKALMWSYKGLTTAGHRSRPIQEYQEICEQRANNLWVLWLMLWLGPRNTHQQHRHRWLHHRNCITTAGWLGECPYDSDADLLVGIPVLETLRNERESEKTTHWDICGSSLTNSHWGAGPHRLRQIISVKIFLVPKKDQTGAHESTALTWVTAQV